ncbi:MAG TPA: hypothetical protein VH206_07335 [Xanthobacteraceae bacterium]|nr:hypothetical protein [Xanthobacteraceae bacterium]
MSMVGTVDNTTEFPTLSWRAVLAGGITSAAISLVLAALGVGLGLSSISPWADAGVSAATFKAGAGVYLVAVSMLSSTVGGYLAGRLRTHWVGVNDHEIYFRDTAHGLVAWAFATVLTASALGGAMTHILGGASAGLSSAVGSLSGSPTETYIDNLLRADPANDGSATPNAPSAQSGNGSVRAELGRMIVPTLRNGVDLSPADRTYIAKVVSARTGLSQADAEARVSSVIVQAKKAADDARKAAASLALWLAGSLLAGAVASMLGATEGGLLRDSKWYEPNWRSTVTRTHI